MSWQVETEMPRRSRYFRRRPQPQPQQQDFRYFDNERWQESRRDEFDIPTKFLKCTWNFLTYSPFPSSIFFPCVALRTRIQRPSRESLSTEPRCCDIWLVSGSIRLLFRGGSAHKVWQRCCSASMHQTRRCQVFLLLHSLILPSCCIYFTHASEQLVWASFLFNEKR